MSAQDIRLQPIAYCDVTFQVAQEGSPPVFIFGVRKSGSSIMNSMLTSLAEPNGFNYVDVAGRLFENGVPVSTWEFDPGMAKLLFPGNVYGGFRNAPLGILNHPMVVGARKILLVRDPRDALVSEYFSNAYSHSIPEGGEARGQMLASRSEALQTSVSDYAERLAPKLKQTLSNYAPLLEQPGVRLFRYESAIMDKRTFLREVCDHFGWRCDPTRLEQIMSWADVMPDAESPTAFVRKVTPGDHREKLSAAAIARISAVLGPEMARFGYA